MLFLLRYVLSQSWMVISNLEVSHKNKLYMLSVPEMCQHFTRIYQHIFKKEEANTR